MAAPPPFKIKGEPYQPPPPSHCTCKNTVVTSQQCPRCTSSVNPPVYSPTPPGVPNRPGIGFGMVTNPSVRPSCHRSPPPPYTPSQGMSSTCCSCSSHGYRPVVPKPFNQPPRGGIKSYYWVDTFSRGGVPSTALRGGHDIDGASIFVGRAFHEGDWIPAKVIPDRNIAYVAYGGSEHAKHQYQVLCEQRFDWVPCSGGHIPAGAVEGGKTVDGESLYVGRVHHSGAITVGKVHPSHRVCYIPFDGKEIGHHNYEILVLRS